MSDPLNALWDPRGRTSRAAYLGWGVGLMVLKYNLDRMLAGVLGEMSWNWTSYWRPLTASLPSLAVRERNLLFWLLAAALPFIAAGVVLTLRRLRDADWPPWLAALFFVPAINLVFFALLAAVPSRRTPAEPAAQPSTWWAGVARLFAVRSSVGSACVAVALTALLTVPLVWLATVFFRSYGWGVFVALPFCLGMFAALFHAGSAPRTWRACAGVALLALLFCGLGVLALALEGVICLLMAAPLAAPIVLLGATVGYWIQSSHWSPPKLARIYGVGWLVLPAIFYAESHVPATPPLVEATTSVVIAAPPSVVWRHVVEFSELPPPREIVFRCGIAYPVRARIWGRGVGAIRHCEFSTGPFVEPITVWDEPHRLAFDVTQQPHPMRELSPYHAIEPAHLNGFFQSRRGQFLLTALPDGRTRLEGTTWYDQNLWPNRYWRVWSDYLVHRIHNRVLEHIKLESEATTAAGSAQHPQGC